MTPMNPAVNFINNQGFWWDETTQRAARMSQTIDPSHLVFDEDSFFAALDAGTLEGQYACVETYTEHGIVFAYVVAPFGFDVVDDLVSTIGRRLSDKKIGLVHWQPKSVARTMEARRARGETGNPHARLRVQALNDPHHNS